MAQRGVEGGYERMVLSEDGRTKGGEGDEGWRKEAKVCGCLSRITLSTLPIIVGRKTSVQTARLGYLNYFQVISLTELPSLFLRGYTYL